MAAPAGGGGVRRPGLARAVHALAALAHKKVVLQKLLAPHARWQGRVAVEMKASARLPRLRFAVTVSRRPEKDTVAVGWQEWSKILKIFCHMKTIKEDIKIVFLLTL